MNSFFIQRNTVSICKIGHVQARKPRWLFLNHTILLRIQTLPSEHPVDKTCESLYMHKRMRLPKYIFVMDSVWRWLKREFSLMFQRAPQTNIRVCYIHLDFGYLKTATKEPKLTSKEMVRHVHHVFNMVSMVFVCQIRGNSFCLISCML